MFFVFKKNTGEPSMHAVEFSFIAESMSKKVMIYEASPYYIIYQGHMSLRFESADVNVAD